MGSCFDSRTLKASDEKTMREKFSHIKADACSEYGNDSYAGHIGMTNGLEVSSKVFKNANEAHNYVESNAQKWGPAIAVKVGDFSKVFPVTATEKKEALKLTELQEKYNNWDNDLLLRVKKAKSTQRGCKKCGSKISVKYVQTITCPVCGDIHFVKTDTDNKAFQVLQVKLKEQKAKITEMSKKYEDKNKETYWFIGAWCAE